MNNLPSALRRTPLAASLALAFVGAAYAQTLPTAPNVVYGSAAFARPSAGQLTVNQASQKAIINWQSFSIGANGKVVFNQPNASSVALNRVVGGDASAIFGSLSANGRVFLVNPSGVLFGAGSSVNVGGLVASTLNLSDSDFAAGRYTLTRASAAPAAVVNEGLLQAAPGGTIALVGSTARNAGTIAAPGGTAALASGRTVTLDFQGDGLTQLRVTEADAQALAANSGLIAADGGRVMMVADAAQAGALVVNQGGIVRARSLEGAPGGVLIAGGAGAASVTGSVDVSGSGNAAGGRIDIEARDARVAAPLAARGGDAGGDGGTIKLTVSGRVDTDGMRADASAPRGKAGLLNIDPEDVIVGDRQPYDGTTVVSPDPNTSYLFTDTINASLSSGTNVTITTGPNGSLTLGSSQKYFFAGPLLTYEQITANVTIARTGTSSAPVTLRFDSAGSISTYNAGTPANTLSIASAAGAGPLNVEFDSNMLGTRGVGGISLSNLTIASNGGHVWMFGQGDPALASSGSALGSSSPGIALNNTTIDTRVGQSDANAGGDVTLRGSTADGYFTNLTAVQIGGSTIRTSTGALTIDGRIDAAPPAGVQARHANGVQIAGSTLSSTSGDITLTGLGRSGADGPSSPYASTGLSIGASTVQSGSGAVTLRGGVPSDASAAGLGLASTGVQIGVDSVVGGANVDIAGAVGDAGAGLVIAPPPTLFVGNGGRVGGTNVTLRASNDGSGSDALVIGGGAVASGVLNVQAATLDANGNVGPIDPGTTNITLGADRQVGVSAAELTRLSGQTLVLGADTYQGAIFVDGAVTLPYHLTLQTGSDGAIFLNAPINAAGRTLALVTGGTIDQGTGATLTADQLLLRAGPSTFLEAGNQIGTLAAVMRGVAPPPAGFGRPGPLGAAPPPPAPPASLDLLNAGALTLGPVAASGVSGSGSTPLALDARSLDGGAMTVRTLAGNLTINGNITAGTLDLVTPGTFQNTGNSTIAAGTAWRLWAGSWVGETRGGLVGSAPTPNLFGCSYGASCALAIPTTGGTFIYALRPTITVSADDQTRAYGDANPTFTLSAAGLLPGDTVATAVTGGATSAAGATSGVGSYTIATGPLASPVGYIVVARDGTLTVAPATLTYEATPVSRAVGEPNPPLGGTVTGFRNGETLQTATTGAVVWTTPADAQSPAGSYAITGSGLSANNGNYVFAQGEGNGSALGVTGVSRRERAQAIDAREIGASAIEPRRDGQSTYVYDRNLGLPQMCVPDAPLDGAVNRQSLADLLSLEWSRLRSRPNLSNCFDSGRKNGCGDF